MRIRRDLEGVVYVHAGGDVVCLAAGDVVPDGAVVGEHLVGEDSETEEPAEAPEPEETEADKTEAETEEPAEAPEPEETENVGSRRRRRSAPRSGSDD
ncbi:hypothetical protein BKG77_06980 [Mycobacteroides chelonae]|uniref:hypothetical protein n=1 Tax=Mycobacteroides chelonae TaxID=1774 RepID=UPI0008A90681|nr:hypothetical protein [Mycobacteroides chelonae]OHU23402.1 hypothetical protein BKG77_06980 [Mycobacteroides chelonae]